MTRAFVILVHLWLCILVVQASQLSTRAITEAEQAAPCFVSSRPSSFRHGLMDTETCRRNVSLKA